MRLGYSRFQGCGFGLNRVPFVGFVLSPVCLFVCVCMYLLKKSSTVVLGRRREKENRSTKDHHEGALWVKLSLPAERPLFECPWDVG